MNKDQYIYICIGVMLGFTFTSAMNAIQPRVINHHLIIDKPIVAEVRLEAVTTCIEDGEDCITSEEE